MEPNLIDLSTFHDLATALIGAFSPNPTSIEGGQVEAVRSLFRSPDGTIDIGIWECTPGRFT
ncbi:MAG: cupin, partial [Mesorhizobium sp.]